MAKSEVERNRPQRLCPEQKKELPLKISSIVLHAIQLVANYTNWILRTV